MLPRLDVGVLPLHLRELYRRKYQITIHMVPYNEFITRWELFRTFTHPLEVKALPVAAPILSRFFRTVVLRENDAAADRLFLKPLETEIYSLISIHKDAYTQYGKVYTKALYQFGRGLMTTLENERESDKWGWITLLDDSLEKLKQMNQD